MIRRFLSAVCCLALAAGIATVGAQTTPQGTAPAQNAAGGEQTIEELYLNNVAMRVLREQATSTDLDSQLLALTSLRDMIENGKIQSDSAVANDILSYLSFDGISRPVYQNNHVVNNFPEVRREACNLMGQIGGDNSEAILLKVLATDYEPMVLAEAVYALGKIGLNQNNLVSQSIAAAMIRQDAVHPDNNFAFASLLAVEKIAKKNSGLKDPDTYQAIIRISEGSYIPDVKQKALQVLDELKSYS